MSTKLLSDWETYLTPFIGQIKLLGEIPLTWMEVESIGQEIRLLLQREKPTKGTHDLESFYYRTFVVYLAHVAAHNAERNYWGVIQNNLHLTEKTRQQQEWGSKFIRILKKLGLPTFGDVGGYRYVTPIRLHGGIPVYSLPDFFAHILLPGVQNPRFSKLPTTDLVNEMLDRSAVQMLVDSPVRYFLEYGREHTRDFVLEFVENCRTMARAYLQTGDTLDPNELNIPPYVVRTFRQFMEEGGTVPGSRLRAPFISLNPWWSEFYLHLPPQSVEGLQAHKTFFWKIEPPEPETTRLEQVRVRQRGSDRETIGIELPLETPVDHLGVAFGRKEDGIPELEIKGSWRLRLLPSSDEPPLRAFHPNNGKLVNWTQALPAVDLWLLYPRQTQLEGTNIHLREEFNEFYGLLEDWQMKWWDLRDTDSVHLIANGDEICAPIPVQGSLSEPELVGGTLLLQNDNPDNVPLFIGEPPRLSIPIQPGRSLDKEIPRWRVCLASRWAAKPELDGETSRLTEFEESIEMREGAFELPLVLLLGGEAAGEFEGEVTGPMGFPSTFRFRIWPELEIEGLQPYYLPERNGAQPVSFSLILPHGSSLQTQVGVEGVEVGTQGNQYSVTVAPDVGRAELHLIAPLPGRESLHVPLDLAVPRLRWALPHGEGEREFTWHTSPITRPIDVLLQTEHASLYIEFPLATEHSLFFALNLIDPDTGKCIQRSRRTYQPPHPNQIPWGFPLSQYKDTLRNLPDQPIFEFHLEILDGQTGQTVQIPLLRLNRTLDIRAIWIEHLAPPAFRLHWEESHPLRNRRVYIWSEWQPWCSPVELKIPDEARGDLLVTDVGLPPSLYRLLFFTALLWEEKDPPAAPLPGSHLVQTVTRDVHLSWLEEQIQKHPKREFLLRFERACLYETFKDHIGRDHEVTWCFQNLEKASPVRILVLYRWLEKRDPENHKAVRIRMYSENYLQLLFETLPNTPQILQDYLRDLPKTSIITPASALLILEHQTDPVIDIHCLFILIKRSNKQGVIQICDRIDAGALSDSDAIALLKENPRFSLEALSTLPRKPLTNRLIAHLATTDSDQQDFIVPGWWVLTDAGWGRIERIQDPETQENLQYYDTRKDTPRLAITLQRGRSSESITFDLSAQTIQFEDARWVYVCTKGDCKFITADVNRLRGEHNRGAHMGLGPAFRPSSATFKARKLPTYCSSPPENEFA